MKRGDYKDGGCLRKSCVNSFCSNVYGTPAKRAAEGRFEHVTENLSVIVFLSALLVNILDMSVQRDSEMTR